MSEDSKNIRMHIIIIITVYIMGHWLLLFVSGYWWDDAVMRIRDINSIKELYSQTGSVCGDLFAYIMVAFRHIYRPITLLLGMAISLLFYAFLKESQIFTEKESFLIAVLYGIMPVNDARITYICFGYTVSLFLFCVAVYLTMIWKLKIGKWRLGIRILCWIFLFISYSTGSLLVLMGIIVLWLYYIDLKRDHELKSVITILKGIARTVYKNIDYIIVPIVFWFIKTLFFQPWGGYDNYNFVSVGGIMETILGLLKSVILSIYNICLSFIQILLGNIYCTVIILFASFVIGIIIYYKSVKKDINENIKRDLILSIVGIVILFLGVFPYAVVGRVGGIANTGVQGRDSLLLGFGMSICIYFVLQVFLRSWSRYTCYALVIILGILHFNMWYLNYQREWYKSLEFEDVVASEPGIKENNTFWVIQEYSTPCGTNSFYNLNVNAYDVLGDQTRFFTNMYYLANEYPDFISKWYGMDEYDHTDMIIDGIIVLEDNEMSYIDTLKLKWLEITEKDKFKENIKDLDRYEYYEVTPEQSQMLVDGYNSGITYDRALFSTVFIMQ